MTSLSTNEPTPEDSRIAAAKAAIWEAFLEIYEGAVTGRRELSNRHIAPDATLWDAGERGREVNLRLAPRSGRGIWWLHGARRRVDELAAGRRPDPRPVTAPRGCGRYQAFPGLGPRGPLL